MRIDIRRSARRGRGRHRAPPPRQSPRRAARARRRHGDRAARRPDRAGGRRRGPAVVARLAHVAGAHRAGTGGEHRAADPRPARTRRARGIRHRRRRDDLAASSTGRTPRVCWRGCARCGSACASTRGMPTTSTPSSAAPLRRSRASLRPRRPASRSSGGPVARHRGGRIRLRAVEPHPGRTATGPRRSSPATRSSASRLPHAPASSALAGLAAVDALRVAAWRPRWSAEVDERVLPARAGLDPHGRAPEQGLLPRAGDCREGAQPRAPAAAARRAAARRQRQRAAASTAPRSASASDVVGAITSVALHFEDGPIALAVVRRSTPVDAEFTVDTDAGPVSAAQEVIVPPEAGADGERAAPDAALAPPRRREVSARA